MLHKTADSAVNVFDQLVVLTFRISQALLKLWFNLRKLNIVHISEILIKKS